GHPHTVDADQIRDQLERILTSSMFAGAPRQQAFLQFVVDESLAGRGDEIKETLIAVSVYEKRPDYDPRIDSTVRVEASKLRQRLRHYYDGPGVGDRVILSVPKGSYHLQAELLVPDPIPQPPRPAHNHWRLAFLLLAALVAGMAGGGVSRHKPDFTFYPSPVKNDPLSRMNSFAASPAVSPKGDFLVYASDQQTEGVLNLWRQAGGGNVPVRLTTSLFNHHTPTVSPDGSLVVFRSDEDGGILMKVPAAGGRPEPI